MKKNYLKPQSEPLNSFIIKDVCDAVADTNVTSPGSGVGPGQGGRPAPLRVTHTI